MEEKKLSFWEHIEALRWHIIRSFIAILLFAITAFIFKGIIFDKILFAPKEPDFLLNYYLCLFGQKIDVTTLCINQESLKLINTKMSGQFSMHILVSIITGIIIAFPYILWEIWRFIKPALEKKARKYSTKLIFFSSLLFFIGVLFAYYIITPLTINFLGYYNVSEEVENLISLNSYVSTLTSLVLINGIVFELPILVYFFTKIGLLSPKIMKKYRKISLVIILILSAVITPPDVFSQLLVCFPLLLLYELSIKISKRVISRSEKK